MTYNTVYRNVYAQTTSVPRIHKRTSNITLAAIAKGAICSQIYGYAESINVTTRPQRALWAPRLSLVRSHIFSLPQKDDRAENKCGLHSLQHGTLDTRNGHYLHILFAIVVRPGWWSLDLMPLASSFSGTPFLAVTHFTLQSKYNSRR